MTAATAWSPRLPYEATHLIEQQDFTADLGRGKRHRIATFDLTIYVVEDRFGHLKPEADIVLRNQETGETCVVKHRADRPAVCHTIGERLEAWASSVVDAHWDDIRTECLAKMEG